MAAVTSEAGRGGWGSGDAIATPHEHNRPISDELQGMQLLLDLAERLGAEVDVQVMYDEILRAAIHLTGADAGMLQIVDEASNELVLLAEHGLGAELAAQLARVDAGDRPHCLAAGLRGSRSTPLRSRSGRTLGMLTTHWRERHEPLDRERRFLDLLARKAADIIERKTIESALRASEAQLSREVEDLQLLQEISTRLIEADDVGALMQRLLDAAVALMRSECGSVQMLDETRDELHLLAWHGFDEEAARHWAVVKGGATTSCEDALRAGRRVVVRDVAQWDGLAPEERPHFDRCGIRSCQSTPLLSRTGKPVGVLSTHWSTPGEPGERELRLLDVVARQAADLIERRRVEDSLRTSDRRKDEFLATLAHELRNPLAPLRHGVQIARVRSHDDPSLQRVVEMMDRQLSHLVRLVDDLLDVGRIHSGKLEMRKRTVSLPDVLMHSIESSRALLESQEQEVTLEASSAKLRVWADVDRLVQVFANLLSNASKFSPPRSSIRMTLSRDGDDAIVAVRDEGIGIPAGDLSHVFDLFSQVRAHQGRCDGGLGIGLAIVRSLVALHGGSVTAASDGVGKGSTFTVRLPLAPMPTPQSTAPVASLAERSIAPRRVLVVDDNVDAGESLAALLELLGHEVYVARDGHDAIRQTQVLQPELIFLDLGMPQMDGIEAARHIRALPGGRDTVIAALTGWGQQSDRQRTQDAGFDLHLVKPIDETTLARALEHVARR